MPNSTDARGTLAEAGFVFLSLLNGLSVWKPIEPQLKFDFVVERAAKQFKVQVKCAWREGAVHRVGLTKQRRSARGTTRKSYSKGDFDILAVFNVEEREFWFFPAEVALKKAVIWCRTSRSQCPHGFDTAAYWKRWDLFLGV